MKRPLTTLALIALLVPHWSQLWAQDVNEADIFNAESFTQSVAESKQSEEKNKLEYLVGGVFLAAGKITTTAVFDGYTASGGFSGKAFVRMTVPSYGSLYIGTNLSHFLVQGQGGTGTIPSPDTDLLTPTLALSEFYLSFDLAKVLFFRVGNQLIAWGPSIIWTPVDFFNLNKIDPQASVDLRVGKPALRIHLPLGKTNLFLVTDFSETGSSGTVRDLADTLRQAVRFDITAVGYEFGLSTYLGSGLPCYFGFDLTGRLLTLDIYGEAALTADFVNETQHYAFSLGFQRVFGELKDWTVAGEFFYNSAGEANNAGYSTPTSFVSGLFVPLYVGRMYAYGALTKKYLIGTVLNGTLSSIANLSDFSFTVSLKGTFDFPKFIPFSVSLAYNGGGEGREFTVFSGDNALSAALEVRFEF
jgi:hypothetical protein